MPVAQLPGWLEQLGRVFPLAHLAQGLQGSLVPGGGLDATNIGVLVLWAWRASPWPYGLSLGAAGLPSLSVSAGAFIKR